MANTKKSAAKTTVRKSAPGSANTNRASGGGGEKPLKRQIGGMVCLLLGIFAFIGYFNVDAWLITWFCSFVKGLIGSGFYILPPMLLVCAWALLLGRGRPLALRVTSALLSPLLFGSLLHLFSESVSLDINSEVFGLLYSSGMALESGGVVSGLLAIALNSAISIVGAFILLLGLLLFFLTTSFGITIYMMADWIRGSTFSLRGSVTTRRDRARSAKEQPGEDESQEKHRPSKKRLKDYDIPIDDEDMSEDTSDEDYDGEKRGFFNAQPRVSTPDQFLENQKETSKPAQSEYETIDPKSAPGAAVWNNEMETAVVQIKSDAIEGDDLDVFPLPPSAKKIKREEIQTETIEIAKTIDIALERDTGGEYKLPPVSLLKTDASKISVDGREEIALNRERLESTIHSFGVSAEITNVTRGPTVTRYDLELSQGVKLAKLTNLAGDLALSLGVSSVRIAPIPDKISTVGVEVPNKLISMVYLRDIIDSPSFKSAQSKLSFAIGEDIGGNAIVGNIAKLPHLLIAGTTGSGKSVCMNSLILSLLYKSTPEEVRLIMIDPKMVELGIYNGIPHLFVPVVTDPKKAAGALQWSVVEMLKRYKLFSEIGVRDLAGYNNYQKNIGEQTMPRVVIVIDELADLMLVASKEVEESICRVAQMGRASGMHLVIATQRPSADVITGLMKANIPSRIAFAVSSALESRIILDNSGAEKLIGAGDMLYAPLGAGKPMRVQGAFVTDEEREKVINFVKEGTEAQYSEDILAQIEKAAEGSYPGSTTGADVSDMGEGPVYDELLPQAVDVIFDTKQASVSMLQRRLKLGYARAARIVDQMEEMGVLGPFEGSKPRQILITKQQWQEMQTTQGTAPLESSVSFAEYEDD